MTQANELPEGEIVSGKFRIERVLGEGGMAVVYRAQHVDLDEPVALKFLRPDALLRPDIVKRFQQEARAAVKLKSEHVARVSDVGEHRGAPYMVMEYLEGANLEELVQKVGPLPIDEAVEYVVQACDGISEAHAAHIVHRDLKPANLFVVERGGGRRTVKVLDFGISKQALTGKVSDTDLAKTSATMGSPLYMSPEQIRSSRDVDRRTDVWALGVVLFELLTSKTPFTGEDFPELMAQVLEQPLRRLSELRPDAPPELEAVVDRCLAKDVGARYQTAAALAVALLPFTTSRRVRVIVQNAVAVTRAAGLDTGLRVDSTMPPPADRSSLPTERTERSATPLDAVKSTTAPDLQHTRKRRAIALVGAGVVALVIASALFFRRTPSPVTTAATATASTAAAPTASPPQPPPTPPASVTASAEAVPSATASAPAASAEPTVTAAASTTLAASASKPPVRAAASTRPAAPRVPPPPPTPSARPTDLDIRRER